MGVPKISEAFKTVERTGVLDLDANLFSQQAQQDVIIKNIITLLENNKLTSLTFQNSNHLTQTTVSKIAKALKSNNSLITLNGAAFDKNNAVQRYLQRNQLVSRQGKAEIELDETQSPPVLSQYTIQENYFLSPNLSLAEKIYNLINSAESQSKGISTTMETQRQVSDLFGVQGLKIEELPGVKQLKEKITTQVQTIAADEVSQGNSYALKDAERQTIKEKISKTQNLKAIGMDVFLKKLLENEILKNVRSEPKPIKKR